jgi:hypothetical protein
LYNLNVTGPEPKCFIDMDGPQFARGVPHAMRKPRFSIVGGVMREHINWRPAMPRISAEVMAEHGLTIERVRANDRQMWKLVGDARRFHNDMEEAFRTMGTPAFTPTFQRMLGAWRKWWSLGIGLARRSRMQAMLGQHEKGTKARANKPTNAEASKTCAANAPQKAKQRNAA